MKRILWLTLLVPLLASGDIRVQLAANSAASSCGAALSTAYENGDCPEGPPNNAPVWNSTPAPEFVVDSAGSYSLANAANTADDTEDASDVNGDGLTFANETGCTLPTGVTIDNTNDELDYDGMGSAGTTASCVFSADDGTATAVNSSAFSIVINEASAFATHTHTYDSILGGTGAQGGTPCFGCNWDSFLDSSPDVEFRYVTNLNLSGPGSFDAAISNCSANTLTIVVPEVSGIIEYSANALKTSSCSNIIVLFSNAPSPGLYVQNLMLMPRNAIRQAYWDYGAWDGLSDGAATGKCMQIGYSGTLGATQDIVVVSYGCGFGRDGGFEVFGTAQRVTLLHSMPSIYPIGQGGTSTGQQIALFGNPAGSDDRGLFARNVGTHAVGRLPKLNGIRNTAYIENVMYDGGNHFVDIANGDGGGNGFNINARNNLCVDGPYGSSSLPCIRVHSTVESGTRVHQSGNQVFGLNTVFTDLSGGDTTIEGSPISTAHPVGWEMTSITASDEGKQEFAELICSTSGPRSGDRHAWWDHPCNEIENRFDGSGSVGSAIFATSSHPDGGVPSIAENSCDSDVENNCGTGKPAVPSNPTAREAAEWAWEVKCAVSATGFPGC